LNDRRFSEGAFPRDIMGNLLSWRRWARLATASFYLSCSSTLLCALGAQEPGIKPAQLQPNPEETATSLAARANAGDAKAQFTLGVLYSEGRGVPEDKSKSAEWFRKAADKGLAEAQYNLALQYDD